MKPRDIGAVKEKDGKSRRRKVWQIYLKRNYSYFMDLESEIGVGVRLSNFCRDHIEQTKDKDTGEVIEEKLVPSRISVLLEEAKDELEAMQNRQTVLEEKLKEESTYPAEIARLEAQLRVIDEALGVKLA